MSQKSTAILADSILAKYPLLRTRCQERQSCGQADGDIEDRIADAVNGTLAYDGQDAATMIEHLALAFLYAQAIKRRETAS